MQHLRGRIAKSDVPRTYVRTHVRTYVPTHPALCLGTSVPRQKMSRCVLEGVSPETVHTASFGGDVKPSVPGYLGS